MREGECALKFFYLALCPQADPTPPLFLFCVVILNRNKKEFDAVNLDDIARVVQQGKLDATQTITMKDLMEAGVIGKQIKHGVKLLARVSSALARTRVCACVCVCVRVRACVSV